MAGVELTPTRWSTPRDGPATRSSCAGSSWRAAPSCSARAATWRPRRRFRRRRATTSAPSAPTRGGRTTPSAPCSTRSSSAASRRITAASARRGTARAPSCSPRRRRRRAATRRRARKQASSCASNSSNATLAPVLLLALAPVLLPVPRGVLLVLARLRTGCSSSISSWKSGGSHCRASTCSTRSASTSGSRRRITSTLWAAPCAATSSPSPPP